MSATYKGESPGKKIARLFYWRGVRRLLGGMFLQGQHVVLASREGGDVSVLVGMGVQRNRIVAVDMDREAALACADRWPGITVIIGDAADVVEDRPQRVVSVFLDFCGQLSAPTTRCACRVADALPPGAVVGVALLRGREADKGEEVGDLAGSRRERRAMISRSRSQRTKRLVRLATASMVGSIPFAAGSLIRASQKTGSVDESRVFALRALFAAGCRRRNPMPIGLINYHSRTSDGGGVPMTIGTYVLDVIPDDVLAVDCSETTESDVRGVATGGEFASSELAALHLNLDSKTVAAWKAHATRGTYGVEST